MVWVVGRDASEAQRLTITAEWRDDVVAVTLIGRALPTIAASVAFAEDSAILEVGTIRNVTAHAEDRFGNPVATRPTLFALDPTVVAVVDDSLLEAVGVGSTLVVASIGGVADTIRVDAIQIPASIAMTDTLFGRPVAVATGAPVDIGVIVRDRFGKVIDAPDLRIEADTAGMVEQLPGGRLRLLRSGQFRLTVGAGAIATDRQALWYLPPQVESRAVPTFELQGIPPGTNPWAPTLVALPDGRVRLYFAAYRRLEGDTGDRANLEYLDSSDTSAFAYGGVAIAHAPLLSDTLGWGIENVVMTERADGDGYRLFFSAGRLPGGWTVYSAVGDGIGPWAIEDGARIDNGDGAIPQGEGMVVLPRDGGGYRMIVGSMQHTGVASNSWSIVEFESDDQLSWRYLGRVIDIGAPGTSTARAVYSPSIVSFGRGAYRMFYTGDNLGRTDPSSRVHTAISFDLRTWHEEGALIEPVDGNLFYASVLGDRLVWVKTPLGGGPNVIEMARVTQR